MRNYCSRLVLSLAMMLAVLMPVADTATAAVTRELSWPREIDDPKAKIIIYQPQLETFKEDQITARAAISVTKKGETDPVFGALWFNARISTDRDERTVTILEVKVEKVRFPVTDTDSEKQLILLIEKNVPTWELTVSLDRILTGLELAEKEQAFAENLKMDPPKIIFSTEPAALIMIDGEPKLKNIENTKLKQVINTPYFIVLDQTSSRYYLKGGDLWYTASEMKDDWKPAEKVPSQVKELAESQTRDPNETGEDSIDPEESAPAIPVKIIISTEPTELIAADGEPEYTPIGESDLLYMSNTGSDVFMDIALQKYFIIVSGRWYTAASLNGPWTYTASDKLPEGFSAISAESPKEHVLTYIAGTEQAKDAILDSHIPQTSAINRHDASALTVTYDGQPKFEQIEDTNMEYAENTEYSVLKVNKKYYCCNQAVWYESGDPMGPWKICVDVPEEIYSIPPNCPVYNVKYVHVYDSTPDVVYVGYTPGYVGSYVYGPTIVYGTGWYYRPWYGAVYYPRPVTYGFRVHYNPYSGWGLSFGVGVAGPSGWFRVSVGYRGGMGYWGPPGYRPPHYRPPHYRPPGYRPPGHRPPGYRPPGHRPPGSRPPSQLPATRANNIYNKKTNVARNAKVPSHKNVHRPTVNPQIKNNVYTDRKGDVYRRNDSGWQKRNKSGWSQGSPGTMDRSKQPTRKPTPSRAPSSLERNHQTRQRGTSRSNSYQQQRSAPRSGSKGRRR